ncbi:MAG: formylglycine-generating enzyme family protein [Bacteroidetes bacterium]|jgi:hypothetical protein|nr:formylglycine-generating enzyme family protein [Bacteroidota bacterium]
MKRCFIVFLALASGYQALANSIVVSNITRVGANRVQFQLSWQNSWMVSGAPGNHDAAWVFVKFRRCDAADLTFSHALLSTTLADHSLSAGLAFAQNITTTDRLGNAGNHNTGAMVRRSTDGIGHITGETVTLAIVGATDGATFEQTVDYEIRVYAIEMVQVPQAAYWAGDVAGPLTYKGFYMSTIVGADRARDGLNLSINRTWIDGEAARNLPISGGQVALLANYPKGFDAFYCMKYEVSAGQYVDFLNTLGNVAALRFASAFTAYRNTITIGTQGYVSTEPNRANNYMDEADLLSYLDWAALRPMTELEYEKVCKGVGAFSEGGFAWGRDVFTLSQLLRITTPENGTELADASNANANCHYRGTTPSLNEHRLYDPAGNSLGEGPVGCGLFARNANEKRSTSGAAYYGAMEMSGNVWELVIHIATDSRYAGNHPYTGVWGDGRLNAQVLYDVPGWPADWSPRVRLYYSATGYMASCSPLDVTAVAGGTFSGSNSFTCLTAGFYMVQVLGDSSDIFSCYNHLGRAVQLSILGQQVQATSAFNLATAAAIDNVNGGDPLPENVTISGAFDRFGCNNNVLPAGDLCGPNVKAIYRRVVIDQNGILTVGSGNWQRFTYRLYRGDASALPQSGGRITGLVDQAGCQALLTPIRVCVTPGTYTLVSFGDANDVGIGDQPTPSRLRLPSPLSVIPLRQTTWER